MYQLPKPVFPVEEVFQLNLIQQHAHTYADRGSSSGLCSRMLDSLKILTKLETDTMECFVGNVSGSVLPERIFLSQTTKAVRRVRVHWLTVSFAVICGCPVSSREDRTCIALISL